MTSSVQVMGPALGEREGRILTPEALAFVADLHSRFDSRRRELLAARTERQKQLAAGGTLGFLPETASIRGGDWQVAPSPKDLTDRRVEITGPVDAKMMINALNSGAKVFMADLEDATSPTWANVVSGQANLYDAVRRQLAFTNPQGKSYALKDEIATLVMRPRGWHLEENHLQLGGKPLSASLVDFGLYFFHNAKELLARGSGPYFYLPKLESHLEARLWNDVFVAAQASLGLPNGTVRATVLIETIPAAFEMEEILFELREHAAGLNAGRWDYIFSVIKRLGHNREFLLPDRHQVSMAVPFMRAYAQLLVQSCHRHGAHAIGGMSAFIPSRRDLEVNGRAIAAVRRDKEREAGDGFDGSWVAHPDLVEVVEEIFTSTLGKNPHQKHVVRGDLQIQATDLLATTIPGSGISEGGVRQNIAVALQYLDRWLDGQGAVALNNLMEDAATAEISRAQLWQWLQHQAALDDGRTVTPDLYHQLCGEELAKLREGTARPFDEARALLDDLVMSAHCPEFLTLPAYNHITTAERSAH